MAPLKRIKELGFTSIEQAREIEGNRQQSGGLSSFSKSLATTTSFPFEKLLFYSDLFLSVKFYGFQVSTHDSSNKGERRAHAQTLYRRGQSSKLVFTR
jgi:hypothetical protein